MATAETLDTVETLIARNAQAVIDLRRLYGFSEPEAVYFMRAIEETAVDKAGDSRGTLEQAA